MQSVSAVTWQPATHECSLLFPNAEWTLREGGNVRYGQAILTALNREQTKSVSVFSFPVPKSMSVQDPRYAKNFKDGFISSGSRPLSDGYTNLSGRIAYWLTGEKNVAGRQASILSYSLHDGSTLYQLHVESMGTHPVEDDELLAILGSFQIHGKKSTFSGFHFTGDSLAYSLGLAIGFLVVFLVAFRVVVKLRKR